VGRASRRLDYACPPAVIRFLVRSC
jgi:hypothetical protein